MKFVKQLFLSVFIFGSVMMNASESNFAQCIRLKKAFIELMMNVSEDHSERYMNSMRNDDFKIAYKACDRAQGGFLFESDFKKELAAEIKDAKKNKLNDLQNHFSPCDKIRREFVEALLFTRDCDKLRLIKFYESSLFQCR
ncbi:hypothetical protein KBC04_02135 [Candidatus Babeliales bacterium]|nr:hypothetical protein [Candidatus Babeliales bacterium]MBP9843791.1 hypothetical protein [Candidatus Babeliales bacterium]